MWNLRVHVLLTAIAATLVRVRTPKLSRAAEGLVARKDRKATPSNGLVPRAGAAAAGGSQQLEEKHHRASGRPKAERVQTAGQAAPPKRRRATSSRPSAKGEARKPPRRAGKQCGEVASSGGQVELSVELELE